MKKSTNGIRINRTKTYKLTDKYLISEHKTLVALNAMRDDIAKRSLEIKKNIVDRANEIYPKHAGKYAQFDVTDQNGFEEIIYIFK